MAPRGRNVKPRTGRCTPDHDHAFVWGTSFVIVQRRCVRAMECSAFWRCASASQRWRLSRYSATASKCACLGRACYWACCSSVASSRRRPVSSTRPLPARLHHGPLRGLGARARHCLRSAPYRPRIGRASRSPGRSGGALRGVSPAAARLRDPGRGASAPLRSVICSTLACAVVLLVTSWRCALLASARRVAPARAIPESPRCRRFSQQRSPRQPSDHSPHRRWRCSGGGVPWSHRHGDELHTCRSLSNGTLARRTRR